MVPTFGTLKISRTSASRCSDFLERRLEQAGHGLLDLVDDLVDDRVEADVDLLAFGEVRGVALGPHVEADDDRLRGRRRAGRRLVDGADAEWMTRILTLSSDSFGERVGEHLDRALHVGLDDQRQLLDPALGDLLLQRLERQAAALRAERPLRRLLLRNVAIWRALAASATPGTCRPAAAAGEAEHFDRRRRAGRFVGRPRSSISARTLPKTGPATNGSPTLSVPSCTSTVATGPRPRSSLASSTAPARGPLRVGLELAHVGDEQDHLEQLVEVLLLLRRDLAR